MSSHEDTASHGDPDHDTHDVSHGDPDHDTHDASHDDPDHDTHDASHDHADHDTHDASHDHADHDAAPVTDRVHENSWSANLETPRHADDRALVVRHAREAVAHTEPGYHVNLVSHAAHGHPESYLFDALADAYGDCDVDWEYVEQCGCGGHVTRVHVGERVEP